MELEDKSYMLVAELAELLCRKLAHVGSFDDDIPAVRLVECPDDLQQCGLTSTTRSDDTHHLSFIDMKVYPLEHLKVSEALSYFFDVYHKFCLLLFILTFLSLADCAPTHGTGRMHSVPQYAEAVRMSWNP